jgi:hypothetical protein
MRAHEFIFEMAAVAQTSPVSIPKYIHNINDLLKKPDYQFIIGSDDKPDSERFVADHPNGKPQQITSLDDIIQGKIIAQGQDPEQGEIKIKQLYKSPDIKGADTKPYNTGNVTEGLFACAIYLRLRNAKDISVAELTSFMENELKGNGITQPAEAADSVTKWPGTKELPNPIQDNLRLFVKLSANNFKPLQDKLTLMGLETHIGAIVKYVNTVEINHVQEVFTNNNLVDQITVRAAGTEDEKTSKVDIDIVYKNENTKNNIEATYSRSVKSGSVDQFSQESTGGAKIDSRAKLKGADAKDKEKVINSRWELQKEFWESFGIDISAAKDPFKQHWLKVWDKYEAGEKMYHKTEAPDAPDFAKAFEFSYAEAAKQFQKVLSGDKKEKKQVETFFKKLQWHARRDDPNALVTNFDDKKGTFEELDFNKLDAKIEKANLTAEIGTNLRSPGKPTKRPVIWIVDANNPKVKFMQFRLFKSESKITNLIEKGPLMREWTIVASG